jgi:hypothetical protein
MISTVMGSTAMVFPLQRREGHRSLRQHRIKPAVDFQTTERKLLKTTFLLEPCVFYLLIIGIVSNFGFRVRLSHARIFVVKPHGSPLPTYDCR